MKGKLFCLFTCLVSPLITACAELPHPKVGGSLLVGRMPTFQPSPLGKGDREERAVDEGPFMRLRAYIERECVYRKRLRLYRNAARHYIVQLPLISRLKPTAFAGADLAARSPSSRPFTGWSGSPSATDSEPTQGGSLLVRVRASVQPSPLRWGRWHFDQREK